MSSVDRKLLLLGGMSPGGRVFRQLAPLLQGGEMVPWIEPRDCKSIASYARLLADSLDLDRPCDVLGISFGGIVAQELAAQIGAGHCFVVSSISHPSELSRKTRLLGRLGPTTSDRLMCTAGRVAQGWPGRPSAATVRAQKLAGQDGSWYRWASAAAIRWKPHPDPSSSTVIRIHGDRDRTFPRGHLYADHVIAGAGHLLSVHHAAELAAIVEAHRAAT